MAGQMIKFTNTDQKLTIPQLAHSAWALRVVRGTEWPSSDNESDGGEGIVGTVVQVGSSSSSVAENNAVIQWDIGSSAVYGICYHGHYDLCVLDNSSIGKETTLFLAIE